MTSTLKVCDTASLEEQMTWFFWIEAINHNDNKMCPLWAMTWCREWIEPWVTEKKRWPNCKKNITTGKLIKNIQFANIINFITENKTAKCAKHFKDASVIFVSNKKYLCYLCVRENMNNRDLNHQINVPSRSIRHLAILKPLEGLKKNKFLNAIEKDREISQLLTSLQDTSIRFQIVYYGQTIDQNTTKLSSKSHKHQNINIFFQEVDIDGNQNVQVLGCLENSSDHLIL